MPLNDEQAKHVAETVQIIAIAEFGVLGYTAGLTRHDGSLMAASLLSFPSSGGNRASSRAGSRPV